MLCNASCLQVPCSCSFLFSFLLFSPVCFLFLFSYRILNVEKRLKGGMVGDSDEIASSCSVVLIEQLFSRSHEQWRHGGQGAARSAGWVPPKQALLSPLHCAPLRAAARLVANRSMVRGSVFHSCPLTLYKLASFRSMNLATVDWLNNKKIAICNWQLAFWSKVIRLH